VVVHSLICSVALVPHHIDTVYYFLASSGCLSFILSLDAATTNGSEATHVLHHHFTCL